MGRIGGRQSGASVCQRATIPAPPTASAKSSSSGAGMDALCYVAAAAGGRGREEMTPPPSKQVVQVEAFSSIHDMIHSAILQFGPPSTLRQIYQACQDKGRIAYKRAGGSRLITDNENWKSQIRHALYTSGRFARVAPGKDEWQLSSSYNKPEPSTTVVTIFADDLGASGSVCGEASHVGAMDVAGNGMQATSHSDRIRTRGGRVGDSGGAGRGASHAFGGISTPRSTRSKRPRTPKTRGVLPGASRMCKTLEAGSMDGSKEGTCIDYDEESESIAGFSQYCGHSSAMETHAALHQAKQPEIGPDRRLLRSQLGKIHLDGSGNNHVSVTEGAAETAGGESARAETFQHFFRSQDEMFSNARDTKALGEICSSHSLQQVVNQVTGTSDPSADSSSPRVKRCPEDMTVSQGYVPIKKRLKAAAAQSQLHELKAEPSPPPGTGGAATDGTPQFQKRDLTRNKRKPSRSEADNPQDAALATPLAVVNAHEAQILDQGRSTRKQSRRPPKPSQTPGVSLRPRQATPQIDTPMIEPPAAAAHVTPTTHPTPASGIATRMSRRMSLKNSPVHSTEQMSTDSETKLDRDIFKAAALAALRDTKVPMSAGELTAAVLEQGLGFPGIVAGKKLDHLMASTLYLDMEMNEHTPFRQEDDGKFGLLEWGGENE